MITGSPLSMPLIVLHGRSDGPTMWINAAIHGDELNGVEIIRQVLERLDHRTLRGTLVAVPVVNVPGFMNRDRYLPDRRDLNRSFPGSTRGSLASQIAAIFTDEIVTRCSVGIDLHTGSDQRTNLPQIRADLDDPVSHDLARAFAPPVALHAPNRSGSLRQVAGELGATVLLFEGGEAGRFDDRSIAIGVEGVLRVMHRLGMIDEQADRPPAGDVVWCLRSRWARAGKTGIAHLEVALGQTVAKGQVIGRVHDSFGRRLSRIKAGTDGVVIGLNLDPIVNQGDAIAHIAQPDPSTEEQSAR
jgi:predicted deacylase